MSMDKTYEKMKTFHAELSQFNGSLQASMQDLQAKHDTVSPLWRDEMRRQYDSQWREFDEMMKRYLKKDGPEYVRFLDSKLRALAQYLRG